MARLGRLVLVVDDEETVRRALRRILAHLGHEVLEARDGAEAVALFVANGPAVGAVLMDLTMPGMDGVAALDAMRRIDPRAPILVSSGFGEAEVLARFGRERPDGFVQKPFELQVLRDQVEQLFAARDAGGAL